MLEHIKEGGKTITLLTDCTPISEKSGQQVLNIFNNPTQKPPTMLTFLHAYDYHEDNLRMMIDKDPSFDKTFKSREDEIKADPSSYGMKRYTKSQANESDMNPNITIKYKNDNKLKKKILKVSKEKKVMREL